MEAVKYRAGRGSLSPSLSKVELGWPSPYIVLEADSIRGKDARLELMSKVILIRALQKV